MLVYLSLAFVLGVYFAVHFPVPWSVSLPLAVAALAFALILRKRRKAAAGALCALLFLCGVIRYGAVPAGDGLQVYVGGGEVEIVGMVAEEPEPKDSSLKLVLAVSEVNGKKVGGKLLMWTTRYPEYNYGDVLRLEGELDEPPLVTDDFNYRTYLARQRIFTTMYYPAIGIVATGQGPQPLQWLYSLRQDMGQALVKSLPEPEASLAQGILLGLRANMNRDLYRDFQDSGTAHLLAISGLHMVIVAGIVMGASVRLFGRHRPTYLLITLATLWMYAVLAGMSPSVVRAAIMVSLVLLGTYLGRQRSVISALALAAILMVAVNPAVLFSVSFQLSFAAVTGVALLAPLFQQWGEKTKTPDIVVNSIAFGLAAVLVTAPLVAHYFGYISIVGLPATFLALLVLPWVIVLSALVAVIGLFAPPVAVIIGWVDWLFLKYTVVVVQGFAALPFSSLGVRVMDAAWVWLYYGVLGGIILALGRKGGSSAL